ncbi:UDP-N-acetylglucosamine--N-acetylmuramyl-(pentapeptide) pyrophosphoryl-undecaprenol N-acetylglucosamine transferase [Peredibacter starrii]|uniref:UDP-N-acetylglucosamine--N-acetylmuramyl-(pentapeptide) pyrophosphoryl-undecaprenol N-acetylglucosamine transferase n=1 Tax=Peredibacter starrii TaxID=28202 RepID=A0AAX4HQJ7_9BACT|nr:UDP-N-acetylglucosamine--N-acetylmuramyl-(pentapeptide) pyrophosphoryl-undecaprenol N-acetylglucosamine transferase [Peredibacter starrii]WPU65477.1 UDP-N-acetylglucosamine--N-acetylmuramyl-(pentapeptide) pyrophosphoryl-undecaprenol N-acetylglucosamine transferase [Peredibacter starrii]
MKHAVLVAGGTGGHINAALAVGEALMSEGWDIQYLTGKRPLDYKLFKGQNVRHLDSKPLRTNNPIQLFKNVMMNLMSFFIIFASYLKNRPKFIVGAGGYVCGPTLLAGHLLFIPVFIIEQNAVMGLTNRILGWISTRIFVHFTKTRGLSNTLSKKVRVVGNPTRKAIQPVSAKKFDGELKVLVFGGSLGATQINKVIFDILKRPSVNSMAIHHQLGGDQKAPEIQTLVKYQPMNYIDNMQQEYEWADVIISRSGASTVSELAIIKKPVLIFPYPQATDNHQVYNAQIFKEEADFTVEILDPKLSHEECVKRTQEFLVKASREELKYTKTPSPGNHTCDEILREIKTNVGLA